MTLEVGDGVKGSSDVMFEVVQDALITISLYFLEVHCPTVPMIALYSRVPSEHVLFIYLFPLITDPGGYLKECSYHRNDSMMVDSCCVELQLAQYITKFKIHNSYLIL